MSKNKRQTRNLAESRKEILNIAFFEVYTRGFQGVSVDDIVKKTSFTKGAFYHQFSTKLELGYALVEEIISPMIIERWVKPLDDFEDPLVGILYQMKRHIGGKSEQHSKYGCPLNNLIQEMAPVDKGFKKRLKEALDLWVRELENKIKLGQNRGFISKDLTAKSVAELVVMAHEGFFGIIKGLDDQKVFDSLCRSIQIYFNGIRPAP